MHISPRWEYDILFYQFDPNGIIRSRLVRLDEVFIEGVQTSTLDSVQHSLDVSIYDDSIVIDPNLRIAESQRMIIAI